MNLNDIHVGVHTNRKRRRIGRGPGSGRGKTSSRGHKGQRSRAGWSNPSVFQGGAMPLVRRVPKRGFNNKFALKVAVVNIGDLERVFSAGDEVTPESLREHSLAKERFDVLKVLGDGELSKNLKVSAHRFSKSAADRIAQAGGEVIVLPGRTPVAEKKKAAAAAKTKK
ncbi:MAG: 50S ribosomal protein L15 [Pirellulaceae bacterium]|nr:50S ribosomal protein L15 [Planctomycetales bacterium]